MRTYFLIVSSKNKKSIDKFYLFFSNIIESNFNIVKKYSKKKKVRKGVTILKSPHVHKKAQEQFEVRIYSRCFFINIYQLPKHLFFFKELQKNLFPDVHIKFQFYINRQAKNCFKIKLFNPDCFKIGYINRFIFSQKLSINLFNTNFLKKKQQLSLIKIEKLLKIIDIFGELSLNI